MTLYAAPEAGKFLADAMDSAVRHGHDGRLRASSSCVAGPRGRVQRRAPSRRVRAATDGSDDQWPRCPTSSRKAVRGLRGRGMTRPLRRRRGRDRVRRRRRDHRAGPARRATRATTCSPPCPTTPPPRWASASRGLVRRRCSTDRAPHGRRGRRRRAARRRPRPRPGCPSRGHRDPARRVDRRSRSAPTSTRRRS